MSPSLQITTAIPSLPVAAAVPAVAPVPARVNVFSSPRAAPVSLRDYLPEPQEIPLFVCLAVLAIFIGVNLAEWRSTDSNIDPSIWPYTSRDACHADITSADIGCFKSRFGPAYQHKNLATAVREDQATRDGFSLRIDGQLFYGGQITCETDDGTLRVPRRCRQTSVRFFSHSVPIFTPDPNS